MNSTNSLTQVDYELGKEYQPIARLNISKSKQYREGVEGYYYILRSRYEDISKDFVVVAQHSYVKKTWHRHLRYIHSGGCTQRTVATCFFHAAYRTKDNQYTVKEVSGIKSYNNYVTIRLL